MIIIATRRRSKTDNSLCPDCLPLIRSDRSHFTPNREKLVSFYFSSPQRPTQSKNELTTNFPRQFPPEERLSRRVSIRLVGHAAIDWGHRRVGGDASPGEPGGAGPFPSHPLVIIGPLPTNRRQLVAVLFLR